MNDLLSLMSHVREMFQSRGNGQECLRVVLSLETTSNMSSSGRISFPSLIFLFPITRLMKSLTSFASSFLDSINAVAEARFGAQIDDDADARFGVISEEL